MNAKLRRALNYPQVAFYGIGTILGAGIYALIGKIVGISGVLAPLSFLMSALLALFTAYSYSQLVKRFPKSGGEAEYVFQGFQSKTLSNVVGWMVAFTGVVSAATLTNGFVGYFKDFFTLHSSMIIIGVVILTTLLAIKGIKESVGLVMIITLIEISGLLLVCSAGFENLWERGFLVGKMYEAFNFSQMTPVLSGAFLAFYAFIGFEDMVNLAEETQVAEKNLSKGIFTALIVATVLYVVVALVAISSLPISVLKESDAPISDMYHHFGGRREVISLIGLFAIFNGIVAQVIMASRILYGLRHRIEIMKKLSDVNPNTQTPVNATLFVSGLILLFTLSLPIQTLAGITSFVILIVFTLVNISLVLSETRQETKKKANMIIPLLGVLLNTGLLYFQSL